MKGIVTLGMLAVAGLIAAAGPGRAAIVDTYSFTDDGPYAFFIGTFPGGSFDQPPTIEGQFTGTVEADGEIAQNDLTAFHVSVVFPDGAVRSGGLSDLSFFSFTPTGGDGSFGFIVTSGLNLTCVGFPAAFSPVCADPVVKGPVAAVALAATPPGGLLIEETVYTPRVASLTLVSSVTTAAPEPSTWSMLTLGFAAIGWVSRRRFQAMLAKHPA